MADVTHQPLPARVRRGYGLGSVATGTFGTVPGLLLLPYLTDTLGVAPVVAGIIVFLPKAWDVLLNPVAGRISDRSTHPGGRRRPFLLRGGLTLALFFALMFAGPTDSPGVGAAWVVVMFLGCATAYAFFQVPYVAMPAELTLDYDERTRLMTWRVAILALAILLSGATAPIVVDAVGQDSPEGYRLMGVYVAVILVVGVLGAWWGTRGAPEHRVETPAGGIREQLRLVAGSADFRPLLTTFVLQALGIGTMLAGVAYVADDVLDSGAAATILFAAFVAPALLVTPLWERYARIRTKRSGYVVSTVLMVVGMLVIAATLPSVPVLVYTGAAVVGVGYAGAQVFPMAMLPDVAARDAAATGENRVGVFTGVWTAGETLGLALGPAVFALVLAAGGYVSSSADEVVAQSDTAALAIQLGFTVLPALVVAVSLLALRGYRLDEEIRSV